MFMMSDLFWLSDEAWAAIERHLPKNQPRGAGSMTGVLFPVFYMC